MSADSDGGMIAALVAGVLSLTYCLVDIVKRLLVGGKRNEDTVPLRADEKRRFSSDDRRKLEAIHTTLTKTDTAGSLVRVLERMDLTLGQATQLQMRMVTVLERIERRDCPRAARGQSDSQER